MTAVFTCTSFAARCDLATGLSLNIAPPGWERTFDPLRDAFNHEHGWSRPDDPSRARAFRPAPHRAYQSRAARRASEDLKPDPRREIGVHLLELVDAGRVKDRADVVAALEERGYDVPRQGEHYVTARDPATGERWRLRGALYERDFDRARFLREAPEPSEDRERAAGDDAPAAAAWEAVEKARRRRADYNRAYYGPGRDVGADGVAGVAGEVERETGPADASLAAHLERELGNGAVAAVAAAAEPVRARKAAAAGGGRGERSLAGADALTEAARAASPELSRALREHEDVADRERAVCATSVGKQWLAEAQQEVLAEEEDRPLSVGVRTRAVKTAEDRLETDLSRRASAVAATSSGPALLQEALGKRSYGDAPLSFSARERGLDGVEQRIDEELRTREEAIRAIPPGKRYLSEAERVRTAESAGPPALADRESMLRAATQQVGEEVDRLEEELLAIAVDEDLLAEAAGALAGAGRTRSLGERWAACERVKSGVEEELDRREAAVRADSAGEEFLRDARLEVLGSSEREAATLGERARIVKAAAEAKRQAETWNEEKAARVEKLRALPGGLDLYHAHLADRDLKWSLAENTPPLREHDEAALAAAESDAPRLERLRDVLSNKADAACYREVLGQVAGQFKTSDLDKAVAAGEEEGRRWGKKRNARLDALERQPGGQDLYHAHLADLDPAWGVNGNTTREHIDAALAAAESDAPRLERLRNVLSDQTAEARYREVLDQVAGQFKTSDLDSALTAAERAREDREWEEQKNARVDTLANLPGGLKLYYAHLADLDPQWGVNGNTATTREHIDAALAAAESDGVRQKRLRALLLDEAATACYRDVLSQLAGQFKTPDLDRALTAGEREQQRAADRRREENWRRARVEKREEALRATSLGGRWLAEAHQEARACAGRQLALVVRERIADTVESQFASNLGRREAALGATASGLALLRKAYGADGLAPRSFSRRERVVEQGEWEVKRDARLQALEKQPGGTVLFQAHLADRDPAWDLNRNNTSTREHINAALSAAESDGRRQGRLRAVLSDSAAAARYREELDQVAGQFKMSDLDTALAAGERERQAEEHRQAAVAQQRRREKRVSRVEQVLSDPASAEVFIAALDAQNPSWRTGASSADLDRALAVAEGSGGGKPPSRQHLLVLEAEQEFRNAPSTACRGAGDRFDKTELGREGWRVSQTLSDRALARAFAAEKPEPPAPRNLAERLFDWLRTQLEKLFRPSRPPVQPEAGGQQAEVDGVGGPEVPAAQPAAAEAGRWQQSPERVAAMENEFRRRVEWFRDKDSAPWVLHDATRDITGNRRDWKTTSPEYQSHILDRADLLIMSGWMVGRAKNVSPVILAPVTVQAAAREIAGDPKLNDWQRTIAAGVASGEVRTHLDRYLGSVSDEEQETTARLMASKREAAVAEASRQTEATLKEWNAKKKWLRDRKPEPVDPAKPDLPTPDEIRDFRREVIRTIKEAMRKDILEKFSEPIRDVVDRAFERGELSVSQPSPPRPPRPPTRERGRTM